MARRLRPGDRIAAAVTHWIGHQTGCRSKKLVRTARRFIPSKPSPGAHRTAADSGLPATRCERADGQRQLKRICLVDISATLRASGLRWLP
jgi:hypothetical protein